MKRCVAIAIYRREGERGSGSPFRGATQYLALLKPRNVKNEVEIFLFCSLSLLWKEVCFHLYCLSHFPTRRFAACLGLLHRLEVLFSVTVTTPMRAVTENNQVLE